VKPPAGQSAFDYPCPFFVEFLVLGQRQHFELFRGVAVSFIYAAVGSDHFLLQHSGDLTQIDQVNVFIQQVLKLKVLVRSPKASRPASIPLVIAAVQYPHHYPAAHPLYRKSRKDRWPVYCDDD
jgi:hypothetical protein